MRVIASLLLLLFGASAAFAAERLTVTTWNVAQARNNPFEYWITWNENPTYEKLMMGVEEFLLATPEDKDLPVSNIFTEEMFNELEESFEAIGWGSVRSYWEADLSQRKIISEFMKDKDLFLKRLPTMADRITNTILVEESTQPAVFRPTVINRYDGDLSTLDKWWIVWKEFMFDTKIKVKSRYQSGAIEEKAPYEMLFTIKKAKYPAMTEQEEADSLPLQTLCCAIFDAIWVHTMNTVVEPDEWQHIRQSIVQALNNEKDESTLDILESQYLDSDIITLQEVTASFVDQARNELGDAFHVVAPVKMDIVRDMNSVILLSKNTFPFGAAKEITEAVYEAFGEPIFVPIAPGDLLVVTATSKDNVPFVVASFHGDTNGLATIPVVNGVLAAMGNDMELATSKLVFGLDANAYEHPKAGRQLGVSEFVENFREHGMNSCFGLTPSPANYTTYSARSYIQPQWNRACAFEERREKGDVNPKDFILFAQDHFSVVETWKDNTGRKEYVEDMVFPTLDFPSDHGIVSTTLQTSVAPENDELDMN